MEGLSPPMDVKKKDWNAERSSLSPWSQVQMVGWKNRSTVTASRAAYLPLFAALKTKLCKAPGPFAQEIRDFAAASGRQKDILPTSS